jgi:hypothetical protein
MTIEEKKSYKKSWSKKDRENHPEKYAKISEKRRGKYIDYNRKWNASHSEVIRRKNIFKSHNISLEEYDSRLAAQEFKCAICEEELDNTRGPNGKCLDHDHETNQLRNFLCNHCNRGLGCFNDSIFKIEKAAEYLRRWRQQ